MRPSLRDRAVFRAEAESALRRALAAGGMLEITVPTIVPSPGLEPNLRAFRLRAHEFGELDGRFLHTSPEFAIKATLADLRADVFTLARCYRDEPPSRWHHAEFTMVEWYRRAAPWTQLMDDCEALLRALADALASEDHPLRALVDAPFRRLRVDDAFEAEFGVRPDVDAATLAAAVQAAGVDVGADWSWDAVFTVAYAERLETAVRDAPTFLTHFPAAVAALARLDPTDPRVAERFELYLPTPEGGVEVANAFGELVDPAAQRRRFEDESARRAAAGAPPYPIPEDVLAGIARLGPTSGIALGWERVLCWLAERLHGWRTGVADWLVGYRPPG